MRFFMPHTAAVPQPAKAVDFACPATTSSGNE